MTALIGIRPGGARKQSERIEMEKTKHIKKIALWATMFIFLAVGFWVMILWKVFSGNLELDSNFAIVGFCAIGAFFTSSKLIDAVNAYNAYKDEVELRQIRSRAFKELGRP